MQDYNDIREDQVTSSSFLFENDEKVKGNEDTNEDSNFLVTTSSGLQKYVLVAGVNYETGSSFMKQLNNYKSKNINGKTSEIIVVDLNSGTIRTIISGKKDKIIRYTPITKNNYPTTDFDPIGKTNYITKKVIYNIVTQIGIDEPGTLEEVSIFSHAFREGPIIANTYESDIIDIDLRIKDIKDRIFDFLHFKDAFTNSGSFKIWGCNYFAPYNYLIKKVMKSPNYKEDGTTDDSSEFIINDIALPMGHGAGDYKILSTYLQNSFTQLNNGKIKLTFSQVKKIFSLQYCTNFAAHLASVVDIKVQYTLPSCYALFSSPDLFRVSPDTKVNVPFFETYLGISTEQQYGIYDRDTVQRLL